MTTALKKSLIFVCTLSALGIIGFPVAAQLTTFDKCSELNIACGSDTSSIKNIIINIVNILLGFVGLLAAIFLIIGGLQYITSAGDSQKAEAAKRTIIFAIVGVIVVILSGVIVNFVISTAGGGGSGGGSGGGPAGSIAPE